MLSYWYMYSLRRFDQSEHMHEEECTGTVSHVLSHATTLLCKQDHHQERVNLQERLVLGDDNDLVCSSTCQERLVVLNGD